MKGKLLVSMLVACLPWLAMAQSNDDLYFVPKKNKKIETKEKVGVVPKKVMYETVNELPAGTALVVKDVKGQVRDVDEYNRRYTSRDNTFSYSNDTLYVEEKPYSERGEWVNGFEGSDSDYEYAMRMVRFRNPRYAIPISSPMYWEVVNGALCSWDWNVFDDGMYAYVFPSYSNRYWWDWRWGVGHYGPGWGFSFGWSSPWYNPWYGPYWYGGYYGGYYGSYWNGYWDGYYGGYYGPGWRYPYYGWGGGYYNSPRYNYNNRRAEIGHSYRNSHIVGNGRTDMGSGHSVVRTRDNRGRTGGRVVSGNNNNYRTSRYTSGDNSRKSTYTRPAQSTDRSNRVYTRPSSTRRNSSSSRYDSSSRRQNTYNSSGSSSRHNSSGSFRSAGGSSRHSSGSVGRSGGGARRR